MVLNEFDTVTSVVVSKDSLRWAKENNVKLSSVLRTALCDIREGKRLENNKEIMLKLERAVKMLGEMSSFMSEKGLYDEFLKYSKL